MKVKLLKDFQQHKKGDELEVTEARANYWERMGISAASKSAAKKTTNEVKNNTKPAAPKKAAKKGK